MKKMFCERAGKPCRTEDKAKEKAASFDEYRRAYKCEFCDYWHITSRLRREDEVSPELEPIERDLC